MVTRINRSSSKFSEARAGEQARVEDAAHVGGMAGAFAQAFALGPKVLELQQALLSGMVQSQQREAERLSARHGIDDDRVGGALERAARFDELGAVAASGGEVAGRLAQTFQQDGIFHGYVTEADGTSAEGYTVRLQVQGGDAASRQSLRGSAKTEADGYFRMELGGRRAASSDGGPLERWLQALVEEDAQQEPEMSPEDSRAAAAAAAPQPEPAASSSVQVIAPSGRVVFEDPTPPTFDDMASEFRYYVIGEGSGAGKPGRGGQPNG
jgi:hypothetical protein